MALVGTNLKQSDVAELLEAVVTQIEEYRHKHSQSMESAKRNMNDADNARDRSAYERLTDYHLHAEAEFRMLQLEIKLIMEHYGVVEA